MNTTPISKAPDIGLIIIGDEILSGKRADKHLPKFIELLNERGLQLAWAEYVGDAPDRITEVLRRAFASGDVVFFVAALVLPQTITRVSVLPRHWVLIWLCTLKRKSSSWRACAMWPKSKVCLMNPSEKTTFTV